MRRLKLIIEYNGAKFHGFARQESLFTVQGELERALGFLLHENVEVFASGRTDKGVHALGQVVHIDTSSNIPCEKMVLALTDCLDKNIRVLSVKEVSKNFHARFSVKKKTYLYKVKTKNFSVFDYDFALYFPYKYDVKLLKRALKKLCGVHNFKAFCTSGTNTKNFEREIYSARYIKDKDGFVLEFTGNGFLYNMVRIMVGTCLDIARGKLDISCIDKAYKNFQRNILGKTASASGLYLAHVMY